MPRVFLLAGFPGAFVRLPHPYRDLTPYSFAPFSALDILYLSRDSLRPRPTETSIYLRSPLSQFDNQTTLGKIDLIDIDFKEQDFADPIDAFGGIELTLLNLRNASVLGSQLGAVGIGYNGLTKQMFSIRYFYEEAVPIGFTDAFSSLPVTMVVHRRDAELAWTELIDYLVDVKNGSVAPRIPDRYRSSYGPFTPSRFASYTRPFYVDLVLNGSSTDHVLFHKGSKKPVAVVNGYLKYGDMLKTSIAGPVSWASVARREVSAIDKIVSDRLDEWVCDGSLVAEYWVNFPEILMGCKSVAGGWVDV
ncbi:hypothetical protein VNI00_018163 [Paramarasmius palmivorus]|uniref:Uncharacterized protein n=1 Tax=Paramarasmius palmivorus TaxID=297713 RepID=A0AAW0B1W0_9AGAR